MLRKFIMTQAFDKSWAAMGLGDKELSQLQDTLLIDPEAGDLIPGCNGA